MASLKSVDGLTEAFTSSHWSPDHRNGNDLYTKLDQVDLVTLLRRIWPRIPSYVRWEQERKELRNKVGSGIARSIPKLLNSKEEKVDRAGIRFFTVRFLLYSNTT